MRFQGGLACGFVLEELDAALPMWPLAREPEDAETILRPAEDVHPSIFQAFDFHHFGYGSTLAILLFAIVLVLTIAQWQLRKRWVFYEN